MVTNMIVVGVVLTLIASGLVWLAKRTVSLMLIRVAIVISIVSTFCGLVFGFVAIGYGQNHTQPTPAVVLLSVVILTMCLPLVLLFGEPLRLDRTLAKVTRSRREVVATDEEEA